MSLPYEAIPRYVWYPSDSIHSYYSITDYSLCYLFLFLIVVRKCTPQISILWNLVALPRFPMVEKNACSLC